MFLSSKFAEIIIKKIREVFVVRIEITDGNGMIIATEEIEKLYTMHQEAVKVLKTPRSTASHSRNGIFPVLVSNEISGYICFPIEIADELVKNIRLFVEAIFKYELERNELEYKYYDEEELIAGILSNKALDFKIRIMDLAERLGYNIEHPMVAIVVRLERKENSFLKINLGYPHALSMIKDEITTQVKHHMYFNNQDIISFAKDNYFIILKAFMELNDQTKLNSVVKKIAEQVGDIFSNYKIFKFRISYGRIVENPFNVYASFLEAVRNIEISEIMGKNSDFIFPEDIFLEKIVDNLPADIMEMQIKPVIDKLKENGIDSGMDLLEVFECYLKNGFNIVEASKKCYLHRNTVKQRLEKLKDITGLDTTGNFKDMLVLNLTRIYLKLYGKTKKQG